MPANQRLARGHADDRGDPRPPGRPGPHPGGQRRKLPAEGLQV